MDKIYNDEVYIIPKSFENAIRADERRKVLHEQRAFDINFRKSTEEIRADGVEKGMREAFTMILNEIPCQKNCECCLRDGDASCFIPDDKVWFVKNIVNTIRRQLEKKEGTEE